MHYSGFVVEIQWDESQVFLTFDNWKIGAVATDNQSAAVVEGAQLSHTGGDVGFVENGKIIGQRWIDGGRNGQFNTFSGGEIR
jgi:hypothetical protein